MKALLATCILLTSTGYVLAQTTYVHPNLNGGYTITTPGRTPTSSIPI